MTDFDPLAVKDDIETELGRVGLHVVRSQVLSPMDEGEEGDDERRQGAERRSHVLLLEALVGDIAFTSRVQDAVQHSMDEEFALLKADFVADEYEAIRRELGGE